ncbi:hypothetical protein ACFQ3Z_03785 [Streptomyces nogalater]
MYARGERRPGGVPEPVAVHGLLVVGAAYYWWQDTESGRGCCAGTHRG